MSATNCPLQLRFWYEEAIQCGCDVWAGGALLQYSLCSKLQLLGWQKPPFALLH